MNSRERVLTAIARKLPDRTPVDYKAEPEVNRYMMKHLGVGTHEQLLLALESDMRRLEPAYVGPRARQLGDSAHENTRLCFPDFLRGAIEKAAGQDSAPSLV